MQYKNIQKNQKKEIIMLKKIAISLLLSSLLFSNEISNNNLLTGDTKLSCEAILCLSSGERPDECNESIQKYFSIQAKKPQDTIKARQNFLKLCPVGAESENDSNFTNLRDNIIVNVTEPCTLEKLNRLERDDESNESYSLNPNVRINPTLTKSCQLLSSSSYTNIKPIYTCNPNQWHNLNDWEKGYNTVKILNFVYDKLPPEEKKQYKKVNDSDDSSSYFVYEKIVPIKKDCWEWQK